MNPIENQIYQAILTRIRFFEKNNFIKNIELIQNIHKARTIRLMQACSYVKALLKAIPEEYDIVSEEENLVADIDLQKLISTYDTYEKPAKLIKLKSLVKDLVSSKKKVLIWSTHLASIDLIFNEIRSENINIKQITGNIEDDERKIITRDFNNPNSTLQVIIATPQSSSESISLHKDCQNAIYYDLNFNAAQFLQSLDRIHRVGGSEEKEVNYYFLHYENSIDTKIYKRVFEKADLQMQVIEDDKVVDKKGKSFNGNVSVLDPVACEVILRFFMPKDGVRVYNPFGGGVQFGFVTGDHGYEYTSSEIRQNQCDANNAICKDFYNTKWIQSDSSKFEPKQKYDLVFTCPPYYQVEDYLDYDGKPPVGELNSIPTYDEFRDTLFKGYKNAIEALNDDCFFVVDQHS